jgi:hypothetical protein
MKMTTSDQGNVMASSTLEGKSAGAPTTSKTHVLGGRQAESVSKPTSRGQCNTSFDSCQ